LLLRQRKVFFGLAGPEEENERMNVLRKLSVGLVALFLIALPALAVTSTDSHQLAVHQSHAALWLLLAGAGMVAGTVSLAYLTPGSGTTPATAAQAKAQQIQVVEVTFADGDTTAPVVTNLGLGTTGASPNTGQDLPKVTLTIKTPGTAVPLLSAVWTDGNTVTVAKVQTTAGTGCVVVVYIEKPHSIVGPK
jgi:hypothetical protein